MFFLSFDFFACQHKIINSSLIVICSCLHQKSLWIIFFLLNQLFVYFWQNQVDAYNVCDSRIFLQLRLKKQSPS